MECGAGGGAEGFGREGAGGAALSRGGRDGCGGTESRGGTKDGADVAGILNTCENDDEWGGAGSGRLRNVVERKFARSNQSGDALRVFGVGDAFEKAVGGLQDWNGNFGAIEVGGETRAVALTGFAEEDGANGTGGAQRLFDEARTLDTDGAGFGGQAAAQGHAEFLEPAIVTAGEDIRLQW